MIAALSMYVFKVITQIECQHRALLPPTRLCACQL